MRNPHFCFETLETRRLMSGEPPDGIEPDIYELNNSFATATNLGTTNNASLSGLNINVISDVDYFKFTAASSGSVGVRIDFRHLSGDLRMTGYNSAQQAIASSNSSSSTNNLESFALTVTAGQLYYIKVTTVTGTSPDYSLTLQPLVAAFDWTMPARLACSATSGVSPSFPIRTTMSSPIRSSSPAGIPDCAIRRAAGRQQLLPRGEARPTTGTSPAIW